MRRRTQTGLILAFALLLPAVASQATAPQQTDFRGDLLAKVQSVCANNPSQVCTTHLENSAEFDPAQCPATPAPQKCVIDYLPNSEIRALMTVSGDELTPDDEFDAGVLIGVLIEFQIGEKHFVVEQQFPAGTTIFGWNPIKNESDVFTIGSKYDSTNHWAPNQSAIASRLVEIAVAELGVPVNSIPVLLAAVRKTPELEVDHSQLSNGNFDPAGSVARYRITIQFAKPAP